MNLQPFAIIFYKITMQYYFNFDLLSRLHQCFNLTRKQLAEKIGIDYQVLYRALNNKKIELHALLSLCNQARMPIGYFFRTDNAPAQLPLPPTYFKPATVNEEYLLSLFDGDKSSPLQMSMRETLRCIGLPESKRPRCIHPNTGITVPQLVDWCNALYVNIGEIISDSMQPIPAIYDVKSVELRRLMVKNRKEMEKLQAEKEALELQNRELKAENRQLKEQDSIGIAASPSIMYGKDAK